jgi:hypothetical protein
MWMTDRTSPEVRSLISGAARSLWEIRLGKGRLALGQPLPRGSTLARISKRLAL